MGLFKTGPLAYNGVLAFWVVAMDFFVWMVVMSVVLRAAVARDEQRLTSLLPCAEPGARTSITIKNARAHHF